MTTLADKIEALDSWHIESIARRFLMRAISLRDPTGASMRKAETQGICDVGVAVDAIAEAIRQSERRRATLASIEGTGHE